MSVKDSIFINWSHAWQLKHLAAWWHLFHRELIRCSTNWNLGMSWPGWLCQWNAEWNQQKPRQPIPSPNVCIPPPPCHPSNSVASSTSLYAVKRTLTSPTRPHPTPPSNSVASTSLYAVKRTLTSPHPTPPHPTPAKRNSTSHDFWANPPRLPNMLVQLLLHHLRRKFDHHFRTKTTGALIHSFTCKKKEKTLVWSPNWGGSNAAKFHHVAILGLLVGRGAASRITSFQGVGVSILRHTNRSWAKGWKPTKIEMNQQTWRFNQQPGTYCSASPLPIHGILQVFLKSAIIQILREEFPLSTYINIYQPSNIQISVNIYGGFHKWI